MDELEDEFNAWWATFDVSRKNEFMRRFALAAWRECRARFMETPEQVAQRNALRAQVNAFAKRIVDQDNEIVMLHKRLDDANRNEELERLRMFVQKIAMFCNDSWLAREASSMGYGDLPLK